MRSDVVLLLVWMVVVVTVVVAPQMVKAELSPSQCEQERDQLVNQCMPVKFGQKPSANCCQRIRVTHVECVCPYITREFANLINVPRTIKIIQGCGRTVPHNFKCGREFISLMISYISYIYIGD